MRILLVDGNYEVLDIMKHLLKSLRKNADIDTASDGDDAFALYCQRGPYDLVLTDDIHPGSLFEQALRSGRAIGCTIPSPKGRQINISP